MSLPIDKRSESIHPHPLDKTPLTLSLLLPLPIAPTSAPHPLSADHTSGYIPKPPYSTTPPQDSGHSQTHPPPPAKPPMESNHLPQTGQPQADESPPHHPKLHGQPESKPSLSPNNQAAWNYPSWQNPQ